MQVLSMRSTLLAIPPCRFLAQLCVNSPFIALNHFAWSREDAVFAFYERENKALQIQMCLARLNW